MDASAVHDPGYRRYEGPREGRSRRIRALFVSGFRRALGLRRSWRAKIAPWALILLALIPVQAFAVSLLVGSEEADLSSYADLLQDVALLLLMLSAIAAAELVCRERREKTLVLIFSRPVTGAEYLASKLGAVAALGALVTAVPLVGLFVVRMLDADGAADFLVHHLLDLLRIAAASIVVVAFYASLALALAILFDRRGLAIVSTVAGFLVAALLAHALSTLTDAGTRWWALLDPFEVPQGVVDWIFGDPPALGGVAHLLVLAGVVIAACALFLSRVRRVIA